MLELIIVKIPFKPISNPMLLFGDKHFQPIWLYPSRQEVQFVDVIEQSKQGDSHFRQEPISVFSGKVYPTEH